MNKQKLIIVVCLALIMMQYAASIGISPPRIRGEHLTRGTHLEKEIHLSGVKPGVIVTADISGEMSDWISMEFGDSFVFPDKDSYAIPVKIDIPADAANGIYSGSVRFQTAGSGSDSGTLAIVSGVELKITVDVGGEQFMDYTVDSVTIKSVEAGMSLPVNIAIDNKGNVKAKPTNLELEVYDKYKTEQLFIQNISKIPYVNPYSSQTVVVLVENDLALGEYWARLNVYQDDDVVHSDDAIFEIMEAGYKQKSGVLRVLETPEPVLEGETLKLIAWFENTGDMSVIGKFVGEIYRDDSLIEVSESMLMSVNPSEVESLVTYFTPEEEGVYQVVGYVTFAGKKN